MHPPVEVVSLKDLGQIPQLLAAFVHSVKKGEKFKVKIKRPPFGESVHQRESRGDSSAHGCPAGRRLSRASVQEPICKRCWVVLASQEDQEPPQTIHQGLNEMDTPRKPEWAKE